MEEIVCQQCDALITEETAVKVSSEGFVCNSCLDAWLHAGGNMLFEVLGWLSALCFVSAYLPQIYRTYRLKEVDNFSPWLWVLLFLGHNFGFIYSGYLQLIPWVFNHGVGIVCTWAMLLMWVIFRDPKKDELRSIVRKELKNMKRRLK